MPERPDPSQLRELLPPAVLLGIELLAAGSELAREDGGLVAKVSETQAFRDAGLPLPARLSLPRAGGRE